MLCAAFLPISININPRKPKCFHNMDEWFEPFLALSSSFSFLMESWWRSSDGAQDLDPEENLVVSRVIQAVSLFGDILSIEDTMEPFLSEMRREHRDGETAAGGEEEEEMPTRKEEVHRLEETKEGQEGQEPEDRQGEENKEEPGKDGRDDEKEEEKQVKEAEEETEGEKKENEEGEEDEDPECLKKDLKTENQEKEEVSAEEQKTEKKDTTEGEEEEERVQGDEEREETEAGRGGGGEAKTEEDKEEDKDMEGEEKQKTGDHEGETKDEEKEQERQKEEMKQLTENENEEDKREQKQVGVKEEEEEEVTDGTEEEEETVESEAETEDQTEVEEEEEEVEDEEQKEKEETKEGTETEEGGGEEEEDTEFQLHQSDLQSSPPPPCPPGGDGAETGFGAQTDETNGSDAAKNQNGDVSLSSAGGNKEEEGAEPQTGSLTDINVPSVLAGLNLRYLTEQEIRQLEERSLALSVTSLPVPEEQIELAEEAVDEDTWEIIPDLHTDPQDVGNSLSVSMETGGPESNEPSPAQNSSSAENSAIEPKQDNGEKVEGGKNSGADAADDKKNGNSKPSRYKTVSYRRIRRGNTRQRIDEFEAMMDS